MIGLGFILIVGGLLFVAFVASRSRQVSVNKGGNEMEEYGFVKVLYSIFLGILLALFLGIGVATFYPSPDAPRYPSELNIIGKEATEEQIKIQTAFEVQQRAWDKEMEPYNRNVSIIVILGAVVFAGISILLEKKIRVIADGIMMGGIFSLVYGLGRGFASGDEKYAFVAVTVGLVVVIALGYHRFVRPEKKLGESQEVSTQ